MIRDFFLLKENCFLYIYIQGVNFNPNLNDFVLYYDVDIIIKIRYHEFNSAVIDSCL